MSIEVEIVEVSPNGPTAMVCYYGDQKRMTGDTFFIKDMSELSKTMKVINAPVGGNKPAKEDIVRREANANAVKKKVVKKKSTKKKGKKRVPTLKG